MKFKVTGFIEYDGKLLIELPSDVENIFKRMLDLPKEVSIVILDHFNRIERPSGNYYDELEDIIVKEFESKFDIKLDLSDIDYEEIFHKSFEEYKSSNGQNAKFIIENEDIALWGIVPLDYNLGMLEEPYLSGNENAWDIVNERIKNLTNAMLKERLSSIEFTKFTVEETQYENGEN